MGLAIFGTSNYSDPHWTPDPNTRGTWSLIQTCVITLGLCVYSALHLNVFHHQCRWWMRGLIRCKWMVIALLAPEFIVYNAWSQRRQAVRTAKLLRKRSGQEEPGSFMTTLYRHFKTQAPELDQEKGTQQIQHQEQLLNKNSTSQKDGIKAQVTAKDLLSTPKIGHERFDITQGYVIVMGGLVVDMARDKQRVWPEWCNTLTVTPACVEECFGREAFKDISLDFLTLESINGRSKVDPLAKFVTIIQAMWFCIQFIVRMNQSLPVSLLELKTFAHSLCALISYILWWHKPGEIGDPYVVYTDKSEALRDLCAAQWSSGASGKHYEGQLLHKPQSRKVQSSAWTPTLTHGGSDSIMNFFRGRKGITLCPGSGEDWYIFQHHREVWLYFPRHPSTHQLKLRLPKLQKPTTHLKAGQLIPGTQERIHAQFPSVEVDTITMERWRRGLPNLSYHNNYAVWLRDRQPNFAWPRGLDGPDGPAIAEELIKSPFMLLLTSLCYGGLHILAWDSAVLRTKGAEETFWKLSCLLLMALGPMAFSVWASLKAWRGADAHLRLNNAISTVLGVFGILVALGYAMSRVYLIVEVFLVIPYMDTGVYEEPNYAIYWPHFG